MQHRFDKVRALSHFHPPPSDIPRTLPQSQPQRRLRLQRRVEIHRDVKRLAGRRALGRDSKAIVIRTVAVVEEKGIQRILQPLVCSAIDRAIRIRAQILQAGLAERQIAGWPRVQLRGSELSLLVKGHSTGEKLKSRCATISPTLSWKHQRKGRANS